MKHLLKYLLLLSLTLSSSLFANANEDKIKTLMVEKTAIFYLIMSDKDNNKEMRQEKIMAELNPLFDFKLMSRLSLHKSIWKSLSKEQKKVFSKLFISRIKASYLNKLDVFADAEVKIEDAVQEKKKRIQVTALLATSTDTKKLIYKFYQTKKKTWLIYDISIAGVSFLQSYRVQYSSYLKEHTFDELLERLQAKEIKE